MIFILSFFMFAESLIISDYTDLKFRRYKTFEAAHDLEGFLKSDFEEMASNTLDDKSSEMYIACKNPLKSLLIDGNSFVTRYMQLKLHNNDWHTFFGNDVRILCDETIGGKVQTGEACDVPTRLESPAFNLFGVSAVLKGRFFHLACLSNEVIKIKSRNVVYCDLGGLDMESFFEYCELPVTKYLHLTVDMFKKGDSFEVVRYIGVCYSPPNIPGAVKTWLDLCRENMEGDYCIIECPELEGKLFHQDVICQNSGKWREQMANCTKEFVEDEYWIKNNRFMLHFTFGWLGLIAVLYTLLYLVKMRAVDLCFCFRKKTSKQSLKY